MGYMQTPFTWGILFSRNVCNQSQFFTWLTLNSNISVVQFKGLLEKNLEHPWLIPSTKLIGAISFQTKIFQDISTFFVYFKFKSLWRLKSYRKAIICMSKLRTCWFQNTPYLSSKIIMWYTYSRINIPFNYRK